MCHGYADDSYRQCVITRPDTAVPWIEACSEVTAARGNRLGGRLTGADLAGRCPLRQRDAAERRWFANRPGRNAGQNGVTAGGISVRRAAAS